VARASERAVKEVRVVLSARRGDGEERVGTPDTDPGERED
jgi:hypothetical protein